MNVIRYQGIAPKKPSIKIPGWGGEATNDQFQPWHLQSFIDMAECGVELIFPYDDVSIREDIISPFVQIAENYYSLQTETLIVSPDNYNILILPHYRYYTDPHQTPLPIACAAQGDWYPYNLSVIFRKTNCIFRKNEPYAQVLVIPRKEYLITPLTNTEITDKAKAKEYIETNKYKTREWKTSFGSIQDNLYNVLRNLEELPEEIKPKRKKLI
jgi:hypothetical protein